MAAWARQVGARASQPFEQHRNRPATCRRVGDHELRIHAPFVAIIVLTWNQRDLTLDCLASLAEMDYPADRLQIIVVDNGSRDGTRRRHSRAFSRMLPCWRTATTWASPRATTSASATRSRGRQTTSCCSTTTRSSIGKCCGTACRLEQQPGRWHCRTENALLRAVRRYLVRRQPHRLAHWRKHAPAGRRARY